MIDKENLLSLLKKQNIGYKIYNHPPLHTVEDSKNLRGKIAGAHSKNLFLKNKKNQFFLFSCEESTDVDLKKLRLSLGLGNISFAKENYLREMLNVSPGAVTPFGLLNDTNNKILYYLDDKILNFDYVNFHPLQNTSTLNISTKDFLFFLEKNKKLVKIINFDNYELKYV